MNLKSAILPFDSQLAANRRSGNTRAAYCRDLGRFTKWFGNQSVSRVKPDDLARFLTSDAVLLKPEGQPRKPISVNRTKLALRSFFVFCVESGRIRENPARLIRSSPASVKEPTTLTKDEIRAIRTGLVRQDGPLIHRDRLIFELLLGTGIRLGSLVALNRGNVNLWTGTVNVHLKGGTEDRVFLNPGLRRILRQFLKENATGGVEEGDRLDIILRLMTRRSAAQKRPPLPRCININ